MSKTHVSQLVAAMSNRQLVRIRRRFEDSPIRGYVFEVGPKFFLLAIVSDRIWLDGFECLRIKDVLRIESDPYEDFAETALKKRGQQRPRKPKIDLESKQSILLSAQKAFPLLTIHLEEKDPDVCHIGKICAITKGKVSLLGIDPRAKWESDPDEFRLSQITRINFGGDYEDALHLVGGDTVG